MKTNLKRFLIIIGAIVYYCTTTIGFVWVLTDMNIAVWWWSLLALLCLVLIYVPTAVIIVLTFIGHFDKFGNTKEEEIDEELLIHSVINQLETDFGDNDFESMSNLLEAIISDERDGKDVLWEYLSNTAQENLKEGLTIKRF